MPVNAGAQCIMGPPSSCVILQGYLGLIRICVWGVLFQPHLLMRGCSDSALCFRSGSKTGGQSGESVRNAGDAAVSWQNTVCMAPWCDTPSRSPSPSSTQPRTAWWDPAPPGCSVSRMHVSATHTHHTGINTHAHCSMHSVDLRTYCRSCICLCYLDCTEQ